LIYDGDGNRVCEVLNGLVKSYLVDDRNPTGYAQVVEEIVNGNVNHTYSYGLDLISQDQINPATNSWHASFYAYDGRGTVRFLSDETGAVTDTYTYDAFGTLITATGSTNNRYLYSGEQFDPNLGLYYLRARLMNPLTGRFWSMDSYEGRADDPVSLHKYLYTNADPANRIDPSGHFSLAELSTSNAIISKFAAANWSYGNAAKVAAVNILIQARMAAILGPFSAQLKELAAELDAIDPTGLASAKTREFTEKCDQLISLPRQAFQVMLSTVLAILPGYASYSSYLVTLYRIDEFRKLIGGISAAATEGATFETGEIGLNLSAPLSQREGYLTAGKVAAGMLDPTDEIAVPLTDLVRSLRTRQTAMAKAYAQSLAGNLFLYGISSLEAHGHVGGTRFDIVITNPGQ
jgi:RHS repeat-associated protein